MWCDFAGRLGGSYYENVGLCSGGVSGNQTVDKVTGVGRCLHKNIEGCNPATLRTRSFSLLRLLLWANLFMGARGQLTEPFPASMELSSLDGTNGFVINGEAVDDESGYSLSSVGDFNGDGISDIVIGAPGKRYTGKKGKSFIVFGSVGVGKSTTMDLSSLNGTNGFVIIGEAAGDHCGISVSSAGDFNGDGLSDILIGAFRAYPSGIRDAGKSYVVFGNRAPVYNGTFYLTNLNSSSGLMIYGEELFDESGSSVSSAGDFNGDGLSDIIIGAPQTNPTRAKAPGKCYVVFGSRTVINGGLLYLANLNESNGFVINGEALGDAFGASVSSAGDMNGDALLDIIIGANRADPNGKEDAGKSYVVFGSRTVDSGRLLDLAILNGSRGFIINGEAAGGQFGKSVSSAGDMNGDGLSDVVIGARNVANLGRTQAGKSYVVFGSQNFINGGIFELSNLNGTNGFIINGWDAYENSGYSVASAGDLNQDGIPDLVIGARNAGPSDRYASGRSYIVYGRRTIVVDGLFESSSLNGTNGFVLNGETDRDNSGKFVSAAGDLNGDRIDDLLIGAPGADPSGRSNAGKCYVVFGRKLSQQSNFPPQSDGLTPSLLSVDKTNFHSRSSESAVTSITTLRSTVSEDRNFIHSSTVKSIALHASTISTAVLQSPLSDSASIIAGIMTTVGLLAVSLCGGVVLYFKIRPNQNETEQEVTLTTIQGDPEIPADYVAISSLQLEMQTARVENVYDKLTKGSPKGNYKDWPQEPQQHMIDQYDKVSLDQLNKQQDQYQAAKMAKLHENYDELPEV